MNANVDQVAINAHILINLACEYRTIAQLVLEFQSHQDNQALINSSQEIVQKWNRMVPLSSSQRQLNERPRKLDKLASRLDGLTLSRMAASPRP